MAKIGLFPMCADLLHAGHIIALKEAKEKCDKLIVCLNCNPQSKNPVQSVYERYVQLNAVKYIDEILPYSSEDDLLNIILSVPLDIRFVGSDYFNKSFTGKFEEIKMNTTIIYLQRNHNFSSTELKERIKKRGSILPTIQM